MKTIFTLVMILIMPLAGMTQNYKKVKEATDGEFLKSFALRHRFLAKEEKEKAEKYCKSKGIPIRFENPDGKTYEVVGFRENGSLRYLTTNNVEAAQTISADKVRSGGLPNYNLSGRNIKAGNWDIGWLKSDHQEFQGKVIIGDTSGVPHWHSTHVGGTMIASGVNPLAKGIASEGMLKSFDWDNDRAEAADEADTSNMLVSNHSYGDFGGWEFGDFSGNTGWHWFGDTTISETEEYWFGRYNIYTSDIDDVVWHAPYYTMVWAAGNERADALPTPGASYYLANWTSGTWQTSTVPRDPDGPYDCLSSQVLAKNVLTVGSVEPLTNGYQGPGSVIIANSSNAGPTDDGRIKPDLVSNGVNVFSCDDSSPSSYGTGSGTSAAAPGIAGSIMLLQEHYSNLNNGNLMRSETVRSLLIHTADEAGTDPGPDYVHGWGLANIKRAADYISGDSIDYLIIEDSLFQGQTLSWQVLAKGNQPLKATIVWNDPPAPASPHILNDTTSKLINDLDLRIQSSLDTTLPWKLDGQNPTHAATKDDNRLDNVEVVENINAQPGIYTLDLSHKGILQNGLGQSFSIIISGIQSLDTGFQCRPLVSFKSQEGKFTDGSGANNYKNNQDCAWLIQTHAGPIELSFDSFDLETNSDFVRVYDGIDNTGSLLGTFTGNTIPGPVSSTGKSLYVEFKSDNNGSAGGFLASYSSVCYAWQGPNPDFSAVVWPIDTCQRRVLFTHSSIFYDSLVWDYGDGNTSNISTPQHDHFYANGGHFTVTLYAYGIQCDNIPMDSFSMDIQVGCVLGIQEDKMLSQLELYPNPVSDVLKIVGDKYIQNGQVEVLDLTGKTILRKSIDGYESKIEVKNLESGVYLLRISSSGERIVRRIVKL